MSTMRNSVRLIGRPGGDPEIKTFDKNSKMARFSIAVNETRLNANNERVTNTQWFSIVAWNKMAERIAKTVKKGNRIAIEGELRNNEWKDNKGGSHSSTEIWVSELLVIDWDNQESDKKETSENLEEQSN